MPRITISRATHALLAGASARGMKPMPQNDDGSYTFYMDQDIFERLEAQRLHGESVDEAIQRIILLYNRSTH